MEEKGTEKAIEIEMPVLTDEQEQELSNNKGDDE